MKYKYEMPDLDLAIDWLKWAKEQSPWITSGPEKYAHSIRLIRETFNCEIRFVRAIFDFIRHDPFWSENCISPVGIHLSKTEHREPKIVHILRQMQKQMTKSKPMELAKKLDMELLNDCSRNDSCIIDISKDSSTKLTELGR